MKRILLVCMMACTAPAIADELPVPPLPPDQLQVTQIAPVPDHDLQAPVAPDSAEPSLNVRLYRATTYDPSLGFSPGSRYQSNEDRKPIQTPGFSLSVPIQ